jgi:hypothetical protein
MRHMRFLTLACYWSRNDSMKKIVKLGSIGGSGKTTAAAALAGKRRVSAATERVQQRRHKVTLQDIRDIRDALDVGNDIAAATNYPNKATFRDADRALDRIATALFAK